MSTSWSRSEPVSLRYAQRSTSRRGNSNISLSASLRRRKSKRSSTSAVITSLWTLMPRKSLLNNEIYRRQDLKSLEDWKEEVVKDRDSIKNIVRQLNPGKKQPTQGSFKPTR
jgi:hypothetical protein